MSVRVAIVGCGLIGSAWDEDVSCHSAPRTHAAAFAYHQDAKLVAVCDQDASRAAAAGARWDVRAFSELDQMLASTEIDLLVVATPATVRQTVVASALASGIRAFVIEKPLAPALPEARALVDLLDQAGARALVNHTRHWDPSMAALRERIRQGDLGQLQRAVAYYGKGTNHTGSHMVDLVGMLCDAQPVAARAAAAPLPAGEAAWCNGTDPTLDGQIRWQRRDGSSLQLDLLATDCRAFTEFRLRLIGSSACVELSLGGRRIDWTPLTDDPDFAGYRIPGTAQALTADARLAMQHMADDAVRMARDPGHRPDCGAHDAMRTACAVQALRDSHRDGGPWCPLQTS
ncbi:MAG: Gfo/Idh/MocA family oxidoreductase [Burkholderiaceae bacterium]|nr:Gfo/Idh/MocA family oxidoreductase [Rhodoferax sp.]MCP5286229.1 Gfo/Idh/MocA family oxidoreductase [Burkholderiaceae bacterium]